MMLSTKLDLVVLKHKKLSEIEAQQHKEKIKNIKFDRDGAFKKASLELNKIKSSVEGIVEILADIQITKKNVEK